MTPSKEAIEAAIAKYLSLRHMGTHHHMMRPALEAAYAIDFAALQAQLMDKDADVASLMDQLLKCDNLLAASQREVERLRADVLGEHMDSLVVENNRLQAENAALEVEIAWLKGIHMGDVQLTHAMNCPGLVIGDEYDCTCGLKWRIQLQTEQTIHASWRKRSNEAEELNAILRAENATLQRENERMQTEVELLTIEKTAAVAANKAEFEGHKLTISDYQKVLAALRTLLRELAETLKEAREANPEAFLEFSQEIAGERFRAALARAEEGMK